VFSLVLVISDLISFTAAVWTLAHVLLLRPFLKLFSGVNIVGRRNIDSLGKYIIAANHNSHLDVCLLFCILPIRDIPRTHVVADREYFSASPVLFRLLRFLFNPIFVSRGKQCAGVDPTAEMGAVLMQNHNIIIFPEGTRGEPGELRHFKSGVGKLVTRFPKTPIVPVFLSGTERGLPKSKLLLLPFWNNVIVGPPGLCSGSRKDIAGSLEKTVEEIVGTSLRFIRSYMKRKADYEHSC